jgi:hypothetical protein
VPLKECIDAQRGSKKKQYSINRGVIFDLNESNMLKGRKLVTVSDQYNRSGKKKNDSQAQVRMFSSIQGAKGDIICPPSIIVLSQSNV